MFVPLTPIDFKRRAVSLYGAKTGVVDGDERFTYREFGERTSRLANGLLAAGLRSRDRVAYLAYNSHPLLEGYYGVLEAGGILLPLNIRLSPAELAYILDDSGTSYLLIDPDFHSILEQIELHLSRTPHVVWLGPAPLGRTDPTYEELLGNASPDEPPALNIEENEVAELFYTSGTTGRPKGVMLTHRNLYLHSLMTLTCLGATDGDVQLHTIPLFHVNGWGTPQSLTAVGGTHVMLRKFDPEETLRLIEAERVTRFFAVPTMVNMILNHPDVERYDLSSLQVMVIGGAPTPIDMVRRAERQLGCTVQAGYGLSETTPVLTFASAKAHLLDDVKRRTEARASTGLPVVGVDIKVVDASGVVVPRDGTTVGEIACRSNVVMEGYWNDADATTAVIRDGWFYTGDMAIVDDEGYITIVDRKKDIIISGGENISSVEIEKTLFEHPAVLETAVIGVPDEHWGEVPKALVVLRPDHHTTEEELLKFCRSRIAGFKVPRSIEFQDALPKGGTGKILKAQLRDPYWAGFAKRVQ